MAPGPQRREEGAPALKKCLTSGERCGKDGGRRDEGVGLPGSKGKGVKGAMLQRYAAVGVPDNGGRRTGVDRRRVFTPGFYPDRRSGRDRRAEPDRRSRLDPESIPYPKRNSDRYLEFANTQRGLLWGILLSLPVWGLILFMFLLGGGHRL
mgnify:CR=1 FL=1